MIIFFGIFLPGSSINGIRNYNFFFSFSASFNPFWIEIMSELTFFIFWIFLQFFLEFSCPGRVWTEFGTKIFFLFLSLYRPGLAKNNAWKRFFIFLNFFAIFFRIFFPSPSTNGNQEKNFFPVFFGLSTSVLANNNSRKRFFNFLIFFLFFSKFSCPGQVWTEFGTKIFFSLSWPISSRFG